MRYLIVLLVVMFASVAQASDRHYWYEGKYRTTQNFTCSDLITNRSTYDLTLNRDRTFSSEGVGAYSSPSLQPTNFTFTCDGTWTSNRAQVILGQTFCTINEVNQYNADGSVVPAISRGFPYQSNFLDETILQFPGYGPRTSFMIYGASDSFNQAVFTGGTIERFCAGEGQGVRLNRKDNTVIEQPIPVEVAPPQ